MVEVQTTQQRDMREAIDQHDRRLAELRTQVETSLPKLDEKYKAAQGAVGDELRDRLARDGRSLAGWDEGRRRRARRDQPRGRRLLPGLERRVLVRRSLPRVVPPVVRFGTIPLELAALPRGIAADARLMEGVPASFAFPALRAFPAAPIS